MMGKVTPAQPTTTSLQRGDLQLSLARAEKSHLEAELQLRRLTAEKQALQEERSGVEKERDDLRQRLRRVSEERGRIRER